MIEMISSVDGFCALAATPERDGENVRGFSPAFRAH
jgi:hypothetical protein